MMDHPSDSTSRDRSSTIATPGRLRVLLVLSEAKGNAWSIRRANKLSEVYGAELCVLAVMSPREPFTLPYSGVEVSDRIERRLVEVLGHGAEGRMQIRCGMFVDEVVAGARSLDARVIVLEPRKKRCGSEVAKIVRRSRVPVLVARDSAPDEVIVAATDLSDPNMPVMQRAARLSVRLSEPVVVVHNLSPFSSMSGGQAHWSLAPRDDERSRRWTRLRQASRQLGLDTSVTLVCDEANPTEAIVQTARTRNADLVVVGTHRRSWLGRLFHRSVAVQVVNRAQRSVLVTPFVAPSTV